MVTPCDPPSTWCKVEALADHPTKVSVLAGSQIPAAPPITILALNMKTTINPKTHQNEITLMSGLMHNKFFLDRPAPSPPHNDHFCAITRPSDEVWPFDMPKALDNHKRANPGAKVFKHDSERALLGWFMAQMRR